MFEHFTDRARKVMALANQEAQRFNHEYVGTEHLLLGLIKEGTGVGSNVLKNLSVDLRNIRQEVEKLIKPCPASTVLGKLPQTPRARKVIEYSILEARQFKHNYVGTEHLLLGLLQVREGVASRVLTNLGLQLDGVRNAVIEVLKEPSPDLEARGDASPAQATQEGALRVAVCQILCIEGDREGNFRRIENALEQVHFRGADIVCFPESVILGWQNPAAHELAAPIPGADSARIADLARRYGVMISIGLDEKDGGDLYGSAILVDRDGSILLKHRKINVLAELMAPPYACGRPESIAVAETRLGRIGMLICADTFIDDHIARMKALRPDLVLVPYGWAAERDQWPAHAKELEALVCRIAAALGCPVVGTDLVGTLSHGKWKGRTFGGASVAADAAGRAVAVLRDRDVDFRIVEVKADKP